MAARRVLTEFRAGDRRLLDTLDEIVDDLEQHAEVALGYRDEWLTSRVHRGVWASADGGLRIVATDDAVADAGYVEITATSEAVADDVERRVVAKVPVQSLDDVLAAVAATPRSAAAVNRLGIAGPDEADARVVAALTAALADDDPAVRRAAANAAGLLGWPELADPLRAAIAAESVADVREMAERALHLTAG